MKNFVIFISIFFVNVQFVSRAIGKSTECNDILEKSPSLRLKRHLFCDYDATLRPSINRHNRTTVTLTIVPRTINFDEHYSSLELGGLLYITWKDEHLTWNATSFDGVKNLYVSSWNIWVPDIAVESAGISKLNQRGLPDTSCMVHSSSGLVVCTPTIHYIMRCQSDFEMWPFDRQNCSMIITSWAHTGEEIAFEGNRFSTMFMDESRYNEEWTITVSDISYVERKSHYYENSTTPTLMIDFVLDRVNYKLSGTFVLPGIIMAIMTLTAMWLDPRSIERLAIVFLNPIVHMICVQNLHWALPHNGNTVPKLMLFYIDSFILAALAIPLTFLFRKIYNMEGSAPNWISSTTATILRSRTGQFLLLHTLNHRPATATAIDDDTNNLVGLKSTEFTWAYLAILLSLISFLSFFVTYATMYAHLIPN